MNEGPVGPGVVGFIFTRRHQNRKGNIWHLGLRFLAPKLLPHTMHAAVLSPGHCGWQSWQKSGKESNRPMCALSSKLRISVTVSFLNKMTLAFFIQSVVCGFFEGGYFLMASKEISLILPQSLEWFTIRSHLNPALVTLQTDIVLTETLSPFWGSEIIFWVSSLKIVHLPYHCVNVTSIIFIGVTLFSVKIEEGADKSSKDLNITITLNMRKQANITEVRNGSRRTQDDGTGRGK